MDKNEFNAWLQRHQKAYPALADWFANLPDTKGTLAIWLDAMRWIDKAHADEATMRMVRGVEPLVRFTNWHDTPRFMAEHADTLKREQKQEAKRRTFSLSQVDGEVTYACRDCWDSGVINVYHGADVALVRKQRFAGDLLHKAARACQCELGRSRYKHLIEKGDLGVFNPCDDVRLPDDRSSCMTSTLEQDVQSIMQSAVGPIAIDAWVEEQ